MAVLATAPTSLDQVASVARPRTFYAPELDVLRFFAFVLVFARHVVTGFGIARARLHASTTAAAAVGSQVINPSGHWQVIQSFAQCLDFGVCLFFFLSSFLITTLLLLEKSSTGKLDVKAFYIRRMLRIWPLYYMFLAVMGILSLRLGWINIGASRMWASLLLVANWPVVLHGWAGSPIEPLWSVSVEEQFYAIWPQFARLGRFAILATSVMLGVLPFIAIAWVGRNPHTENTMYWANSLVQCLFFSGGAITAVRLRRGAPEFRRTLRIAMFFAGCTCWLAASGICKVVRTLSPGVAQLATGYCLVLAGTILLFLSLYGWHPQRFPRRLAYAGKISYGLYVFHFFWLELLCRFFETVSAGHQQAMSTTGLIVGHSIIALSAFALTLGSASLSYRFLESPFLRLKSRFAVVSSRPA